MSYKVIFTPEAEAQLIELYGYIATAESPEVAARYTNSIVTYCESLQTLPHRGIQRDDIRPRPTHHELPKTQCDRVQCGC
jgi:toxin ParE1/3/4